MISKMLTNVHVTCWWSLGSFFSPPKGEHRLHSNSIFEGLKMALAPLTLENDISFPKSASTSFEESKI